MYKILWVCQNSILAAERREMFNHPGNIKFIQQGGALTGHGFDEIILDNIETLLLCSQEAKDLQKEWLNEYLPTKLFPEGRMLILRPHLD